MSDPNSAAVRARDKLNREMRECVALGLLVGMPYRLGRGETRITRARKEIAHMRELDEVLGPADLPTHASRFREIHEKSLDYFDEVLSAELPFDAEHAELARLHTIKLTAAAKTIQIASRVAIELYRGQRTDVIQRILERHRLRQAGAVEHEPQIIGFEEVS